MTRKLYTKSAADEIARAITVLDGVFPLQSTDFFEATKSWPFDKAGAYMALLTYQWDHGSLPTFGKIEEQKAMGFSRCALTSYEITHGFFSLRIKEIEKHLFFVKKFYGFFSVETNGLTQTEIIEKYFPGCGEHWVFLSKKFVIKDGVLKNLKVEQVRNNYLVVRKYFTDHIMICNKFHQASIENGKCGGRPKRGSKTPLEKILETKFGPKAKMSPQTHDPLYIDNNTLHIEVTNINKKNRVRDRSLRKEKEERGKLVWKKYPNTAQKTLPLPEEKIQSLQELLGITRHIEISPDKILTLWKVFKENHFTGENYYQSESKVYNHFLNETKKQPFNQTNGVHKPVVAGARPIVQNVDPADRGYL